MTETDLLIQRLDLIRKEIDFDIRWIERRLNLMQANKEKQLNSIEKEIKLLLERSGQDEE